jgi:hypothetical protein
MLSYDSPLRSLNILPPPHLFSIIDGDVRNTTNTIPISYSWVKGHSESGQWSTISDLQSQQLSRDQIYNIWCDKTASHSWNIGSPAIYDPDVTIEEQWAVYALFPCYHKLTGNLSGALTDTLAYNSSTQYLHSKHKLMTAKVEHINTVALQQYLSKLPIFKRATIVKMIHGWNPSLAILCHQGRAPSPICSRCSSATETNSHIIQCPNSLSIANRISRLRNFLRRLSQYHTPTLILRTLHYKLSLTLHIPFDYSSSTSHTPYDRIPDTLLRAIRHQNLIGWDLFLCGYTSMFWQLSYSSLFQNNLTHPDPNWGTHLVTLALELYKGIWDDRNLFYHGSSS